MDHIAQPSTRPRAQTQTYFDALFKGVPGFIEIRLIEPDGPSTRRISSSIDEALRIVDEARSRRVNVFPGIATRASRSTQRGAGGKENLRAVNALWVDIDWRTSEEEEEALAAIDRCPIPPSLVIHSGKGRHLYWLLDSPRDLRAAADRDLFEDTLRGLVETLEGDRAATDASRILRAPGTYNHPNARKREAGRETAPCRILEARTDLAYPFEEFRGYTERGEQLRIERSQPRSRKSTRPATSRDLPDPTCPDRVHELLAAKDGDGHALYPGLVARWEGSTEGLEDDASPSQIDQSIANLLAARGVGVEDIGQALRFRRDLRGLDEKHGAYYEQTADEAVRWARRELLQPAEPDLEDTSEDPPESRQTNPSGQASPATPTQPHAAPSIAPLRELEREQAHRRLIDLGVSQETATRSLQQRDTAPESAAVDCAQEILQRRLERFGSRPSTRQLGALRQILVKYAELASGRGSGRFAYDLDLGCGKTQSVVAFIAAIDALDLPWAVAVAAVKVEANCSLQRQLIEAGVRTDEIAQLHSKRYHPDKAESARAHKERDYASEPSLGPEEARGRKYLLATQERFRRLRDSQTGELQISAIQYRDQARPLVIWDEALMTTEGKLVSSVKLKDMITAFSHRLHDMPREKRSRQHERVQDWLEQLERATFWRLLDVEDTHGEPGKPEAAHTVEIPPLAADLRIEDKDPYNSSPAENFLKRYREILSHDPPNDPSLRETAKTIADLAGTTARAVNFRGQKALLGYTEQVPDAISNIVILDASYPIRLLQNLDGSIQKPQGFNGKVKDWSRVTLHHMPRPSGRGALTREFSSRNPDDWHTAKEVVEVMKNHVLPGQGALIFAFKDRHGDNHIEKLRRLMRAEDIDPDEKIVINGRSVDRWPTLTWGNETSLSDYAYCHHVILMGVLHRDRRQLAAAALGAMRNPEEPLSPAFVAQLERSELAHVIYQAAGRGRCRQVIDGVAESMEIWLPIQNERLISTLRRVSMPGLRVEAWKPRFLPPESRAQWRDLAEEILGVLVGGIPEEIESLSIIQLKREYGWTDASPKTFKKALDYALGHALIWRKKDRTLVRVEEPLLEGFDDVDF